MASVRDMVVPLWVFSRKTLEEVNVNQLIWYLLEGLDHAHKILCLLGVLFKISDNHPRHFSSPPQGLDLTLWEKKVINHMKLQLHIKRFTAIHTTVQSCCVSLRLEIRQR